LEDAVKDETPPKKSLKGLKFGRYPMQKNVKLKNEISTYKLFLGLSLKRSSDSISTASKIQKKN